MVRARPTLIAMVVLGGVMAATLFGGGACSRSGMARFVDRGLISRAEEKLRSAPRTRRSLADEGRARCLKDRLNPRELRLDIAEREARIGGTPITGAWNGIDLSTLPRPQGVYLDSHSRWIQSGSGVSFTGCRDVPCALGRAYGGPDTQPGLRAYWWYLRMGSVLSCAKQIPGLSVDTTRPHTDYLFKEGELDGFWRVSWMVSDSYRAMTSLQTIHRLAPHTYLDSYRGFPMGETTCGLNHGSKNSGIILLMDGCLNLDGGTGTSNFFYIGVTHELSHALDHNLGTVGARLASTEEWTGFSGWTEHEAVDPIDGETRIRWRYDSSKDGFVSDYAKTSPYEDFAETAAFFRFDPDTALRLAPKKSGYISRRLYGMTSFDPKGLARAYEDRAVAFALGGLPELVQRCVTETPEGAPSPSVTPSVAAVSQPGRLVLDAVPAAVVTCLEQGLDLKINEAFGELRATEYEACDFLASNEAIVRGKAAERLTPEIARLASEEQRLAPLVRAVKKLRLALARQIDAREGFRLCYVRSDAEACFNTAIAEAFDRVSQPQAAELGEMLVKERGRFLAENSFTNAGAQTAEFFRWVFSGIDSLLAERAEGTWRTCAMAPDPGPVTLLTSPFSGGAQYVSAGILNCINGIADEDVRLARDLHSSRLGIGAWDVAAQAYIRDLLMPRYLAVLDESLAREASDEAAQRTARKPEILGELSAELARTEDTWMGSLMSREAAIAACRPVAEAGFPARSLPTRFAAVEDLRRDWSREACEKYVGTPAVSMRLRGRAEAAFQASLQALDSLVQVQAVEPGKTCKRQNPGKWDASKRKRCLERAWPDIETRALADWDATDGGRTFVSRRTEAVTYLRAKERKKRRFDAAVAAMEAVS